MADGFQHLLWEWKFNPTLMQRIAIKKLKFDHLEKNIIYLKENEYFFRDGVFYFNSEPMALQGRADVYFKYGWKLERPFYEPLLLQEKDGTWRFAVETDIPGGKQWYELSPDGGGNNNGGTDNSAGD